VKSPWKWTFAVGLVVLTAAAGAVSAAKIRADDGAAQLR
jgi:hypothetical protein